jgi:Spy/CpxP family protein refolding chaperone
MRAQATTWLLVVGLLLVVGTAAAQPVGTPPDPPMGASPDPPMGAPPDPPMGGPMGGGMRGPMGVPMGRWWESPKVVEQLGLTPEQAQKLEAVTLDQARTMVDFKSAVEKAEIDLRAASDAEPFNTKRVRDAFGALLQARTKLETQRFEMLLKTREVLTADQWRKLRELAREKRLERGKGGPHADEHHPGGPGGWDE